MLSNVRGFWVERCDASAANVAMPRLRRRRETRSENPTLESMTALQIA